MLWCFGATEAYDADLCDNGTTTTTIGTKNNADDQTLQFPKQTKCAGTIIRHTQSDFSEWSMVLDIQTLIKKL